MNLRYLLSAVFMTFIVMNITAQTWNCGYPNETDVKATLINGTMTVSGTGKMKDYGWIDSLKIVISAPWDEMMEQIRSVVIEDGITSIGSEAFLFSDSLSDLSIGSAVETIGLGAFDECNFSIVNIPYGVKKLGAKSFAWNAALKFLIIPESVEVIQEFAFAGDSGLEEISISWTDPADVIFTAPDDCPSCAYEDPFYAVAKDSVILHVPVGTKAAYQAAEVWKDFIIVDDGVIVGKEEQLLTDLTVSQGTLTPAFNPGKYNYRMIVPKSVENITLTATPVEGATVSGDGLKQLNVGTNTFTITANIAEKSVVYTVVITRMANDYLLAPLHFNEITTGDFTVTYFDLVRNGNVTTPVIDKYEIEYQLLTGNVSGDLPLHFDMENGRYTHDKTVNVEANSIYTFTLSLNVNYRDQGDLSFITHIDDFGNPSSTSINYTRHICNLVASVSNNETLSTTEINMVGSSISNISVSDLTFVGNGNYTSIENRFVSPAIIVNHNPAEDFVTISGLQGDETLRFYNINGNLLFSHKAVSEAETIPVSHLPAGVYVVKLDNGQALKWAKR